MKRLLILLFVLTSAFCSTGQTVGVKISELTTYLGAGDSAYVPVTIGGATRKMFGKDLARGKVDSVKIVSGTLYFYKGGTGYSAGSVATSQAFADLTGKPTTLSGYGITDAVTETRFLDSLQDVRSAITASGGSSTLPSMSGNSGKVLTVKTDESAAEWTGVAKYSFTDLQDGQLIKAQIADGDTTFVNFTPDYGTGGATADTAYSIPYLTTPPATGNIFLHALTHKLWVKNDAGTFWLHFTPTDSTAIVGDGSYAPDAEAYFLRVASAGYSMSTGEKNAVNDFYTAISGFYAKFKELYLFSGNIAASQALGFKNAHNLTFAGTWTHAATGAKGDGSSAYAQTGIVPSTTLTNNDYAFGVHNRAASINTGVDIGCYSSETQRLDIDIFVGGSTAYACAGAAAQIMSAANSPANGLYTLSRVSSTDAKLFKNGTQLTEQTAPNSGGLPTHQFYIGGYNYAGGAGNYSTAEYTFGFVASGLTPTEVATLNTALTALNTALGR
jgi:hypothetical protein